MPNDSTRFLSAPFDKKVLSAFTSLRIGPGLPAADPPPGARYSTIPTRPHIALSSRPVPAKLEEEGAAGAAKQQARRRKRCQASIQLDRAGARNR
jgi:hypothetical protein